MIPVLHDAIGDFQTLNIASTNSNRRKHIDTLLFPIRLVCQRQKHVVEEWWGREITVLRKCSRSKTLTSFCDSHKLKENILDIALI